MEKPLDLQSEELMGTERHYNLKCKVKKIRQTYREIDDGKQHETTSVILVPDVEQTEAMMFLTAWLPEVFMICIDCGNENLKAGDQKCNKCGSQKVKLEHTECASFIGYPVNSPCRLAVLRKNNYCDQHHLYVMSTGVEQELLNMEGKLISVTTFKGTEDHLVDKAPSITRTVKG